MSFSPDAKCLATASQNGTVQVYPLDPHELLNLARSRVPRNFTAVCNLPALAVIKPQTAINARVLQRFAGVAA